MPRLLVPLAVSLVTLTLALLGAAWAATGKLPLLAASRAGDAPRIAAADATGPLIANDREGTAVLAAGALAPGETTAGEVTIRNAGAAAGIFTLTAHGADASPLLSEVLGLSVLDVTGATPATVFSGSAAALAQVGLGRFAAGAARRYRFVLTFPAGRPAAMDDPLQGTSASLSFTWSAGAARTAGSSRPGPARGSAVAAGTAGSSGPVAPGGPAPPPAPPSSAGAAAPAPAPSPARPRALQVRITRVPGAVRDGLLVTRLSATTAASGRLTGSITVAGRRTALRTTRVRLSRTRRTVRVALPREVLIRSAGRPASIRLALTAGAGSARATVRRTLRVTLPRRAPSR
jgi:hypothetical protein